MNHTWEVNIPVIFPQGIINYMIPPAFKTVTVLISVVDLMQSARKNKGKTSHMKKKVILLLAKI